MPDQHPADPEPAADREGSPLDALDTPAGPPQHAEPRDAARAARRQAKLERIERERLRKAERAARGPGAWRSWVLPSLKLLVAAVIAVALVKLAFFPDPSAADAGAEPVPGAVFDEPTVALERGSIESTVDLDGTVVPVEPVPVRSSQTGTVARVLVDDGAAVSLGDPLYTVRVESQPEPDAEGVVGPPQVAIWNVRAPAAGTLTGFALLPGQTVDVAGETGAVQPPQHLVQASVGAADQYRLTTQPESATVTIDAGPAPFDCSGIAIRQPSGEEAGTGATATLTCEVPDGVRVFTGLSASVELAAGSAEDVLLLPTTAVLGSADAGIVYRPVLGPDGMPGEPEEVRVELGLSDGTVVEVRSGLADGDEVLQFVPGAVDPCADPMTADPAACGGEVWP